jgi:hypothetical protein
MGISLRMRTRTAAIAVALAAAGHPVGAWAVPPQEPAWRNARHLLEPDERITFAVAQPGTPNLILTLRPPDPGSDHKVSLLDEDGGSSGKSVAIGLAVAAGVVVVALVIIYFVAVNRAAHAP